MLEKEQVQSAKARGFLLNRGTECFSGRVVSAGGVYTAAQLERIAACASKYGAGKVVVTSRLSAEITGIPYENIQQAIAFIEQDGSGLVFGGTGARIRPITACKGTTCVFGGCDTQTMAQELHQKYYLGQGDATVPKKFKIAVGGCPNSCMKPSLNDFGIEARGKKDGAPVFMIYIGGMWGKKTRAGTPLPRKVAQEEILPLLDATLKWYTDNALPGERLGHSMDRLGTDALLDALGMG